MGPPAFIELPSIILLAAAITTALISVSPKIAKKGVRIRVQAHWPAYPSSFAQALHNKLQRTSPLEGFTSPGACCVCEFSEHASPCQRKSQPTKSVGLLIPMATL